MRSHDFFFFKFAPVVKKVHTVELTYVGEVLCCSGILHKELNKITKYIGQSCGFLLSVQENTEVLPQIGHDSSPISSLIAPFHSLLFR